MTSKPTRTASRPSAALYIAAGLAQLWGLIAVRYQLSEPGFGYALMGITAAGLWCAWHLRLKGVTTSIVPIGAAFAGMLLLAALTRGSLFPTETFVGTELSVIIALAFTAALSNFFAVTDEAVLFTMVWFIAILGLSSCIDLNRELVILFFLFLLAVAFLLIHQNYLAQAGRTASHTLLPRRILQLQALTAAATWIGAGVLGTLLAIPLRAVGKGISLREVMEQLKLPKSALAGSRRLQSASPRLNFDSRTEFLVGLGPIPDDTTEVMTVESPTPRYWRGRSFTTYAASGWSGVDQGANTPIVADVPGAPELQFSVAPERSVTPKEVTVETHRFKSVGPVFGSLFHAAEPLRVRGAFEAVARRDDGTLVGNLGRSKEYEVESEICTATPEQLDRSSTRYPEEIRQRYLWSAAPSPVIERLTAEALSGVQGGPFTRVEALRRFIMKRCTYSLNARAVPSGRDPVDFFLNESREGYCDLFATALTVLCRQAGLPARIVTGFNSGNPDAERPGLYHLTNSNRHAWTEVYFVGYGWISFDATVSSAIQNAAPPPTPPLKSVSWRDRLAAVLPYLLMALGGVGLLITAGGEVLKHYRRTALQRVATLSPQARRIGKAYHAALHALRRAGAERLPSMSTDEHVDQVAERLGEPLAATLRPLAWLADRAAFAKSPPDEAEADEAERLLTNLRHALKERPHARTT